MGNGLITGITAITALIATVINLIAHLGSVKKSKEAKREDDYYNKVLRPYIKNTHENKAKNATLDFFKEVDINEPFIPPYIRYVYYCKKSAKVRNKQLHKLLTIDYINMYENERRAIDRFFKVADRVQKVVAIIVFILFGVFFVLLGIDYLIYNLKQIETLYAYAWIPISIIEMIISVLAFSCFYALVHTLKVDNDMYSTRKKKIKKQINNLEADYKRITNNNYY